MSSTVDGDADVGDYDDTDADDDDDTDADDDDDNDDDDDSIDDNVDDGVTSTSRLPSTWVQMLQTRRHVPEKVPFKRNEYRDHFKLHLFRTGSTQVLSVLSSLVYTVSVPGKHEISSLSFEELCFSKVQQEKVLKTNGNLRLQ